MNSIETNDCAAAPVRTQALVAGAQGRALRRIWIKLLAFVLPVAAILAPMVYWIDPFNLFDARSPLPVELRMRYAAPINQALWKVLAFNRHPEPDILLGDSQVARLPGDEIRQASGEPYANLGDGGATLRETIDMFWFASRKTRLHHVLFGIDFMSYNADPRDRLPQAEAIAKNPVFYFLNSDVLEAGAYQVGDAFFHHPTNLGPQQNRAEFWKFQLAYLADRYKRISDPGSLRLQLKAITAYARENGISFAFLIPPQHMDAQQRVRALGAEDQYQQFKRDLAGMAEVYDCDIDNNFTRDRDNFLDPFHLEDAAAKELVVDLWSAHPSLCRRLGSK